MKSEHKHVKRDFILDLVIAAVSHCYKDEKEREGQLVSNNIHQQLSLQRRDKNLTRNLV